MRPKYIQPGLGRVVFNGVTSAYLWRAKRVVETSHPPVYYIPPEDITMECLSLTSRAMICE